MRNRKRRIILAAACMILLGSTVPTWCAVSGTFTYGSFIRSNFQAPFYYDDAYFLEPSTKYADSLATMSMCLALSAFASKGTNDYTQKSENLQALLAQCGFALVTKVAPTMPSDTFGFDRYGICMYLPCVLYDGKTSFLQKQKKMLE